MGLRAVKNRVLELLAGAGSFPEVRLAAARDLAPEELPPAAMEEILALPRPQVLKVLIAALCHHDPQVRWRAVSAMGPVVADLARQDLEPARVVMRRFMWSLNDESGGIGWGAPEAMAECLVHHPGLAEEYGHILVSFMREDGFFLEYPPLQRGLMWGLGRLAATRPALLREKGADLYLLPYLDSPDPEVRGLAARALGLLGAAAARPSLEKLNGQPEPVTFYQHGRLLRATVGELAGEALARLP